MRRLLTALSVALLTGASAAQALNDESTSDAAWQQHKVATADGTNMLAMAANPKRSTFVLLYSKARADDSPLRLVALDGSGKQTAALDLVPPLFSEDAPLLYERVGLAIDASDLVYLIAASHGRLHLARIDLRGTAAPFSKTLNIGDSSITVSTLRLSRQGMLMLAGSVDGKGFVASISPRGELNWARRYNDVFAVFDLVESDTGFILAGGTPGKMFPQSIWLARIGASGDVLENQMRQGPAHYAYLADDGRRLGLVYDKLGSDLLSGCVLLELFANGTSLRATSSQTFFEGRVSVPFVLSGYAGSFTAAGIGAHGQLQIIEVDADGRQVPIFQGQLRAPDYMRFHSVEMIRGPDAHYLAGLRSHAEGRRQRRELMFIKIPRREGRREIQAAAVAARSTGHPARQH